MSIQRWHMLYEDAMPERLGKWVTYDDHLEALRDCEGRVHEAAYQAGKAYGLTVNGYTRGLDAAREAVVVLCWRKQYEGFVSTVDPQRVLAAIDALREELHD